MTIFALRRFQSHEEAIHKLFRRNIGGVWRKAYVFKFNKTFTWIPPYKWNVSLNQHHKEIMGILKGLQVTVMHPSEKPNQEKKACTFPYMSKNERVKVIPFLHCRELDMNCQCIKWNIIHIYHKTTLPKCFTPELITLLKCKTELVIKEWIKSPSHKIITSCTLQKHDWNQKLMYDYRISHYIRENRANNNNTSQYKHICISETNKLKGRCAQWCKSSCDSSKNQNNTVNQVFYLSIYLCIDINC